jgi:hypothetical protein
MKLCAVMSQKMLKFLNLYKQKFLIYRTMFYEKLVSLDIHIAMLIEQSHNRHN